ncbi:MAG TPA: hypothetical protein VNI20_11545 [Fimbriimonadaceae bacterium]|nr:hypothetical protein [Fimbriimonadaceae bacterium]
MKTKTVTEQSGIAEFEVPVDWKMIPAKDDASVQFYPKQRDVVFRASANTYELQGSRLVLLVFTLSDFLPPGHKRSKAAIATAEHAVDSTRFT